MLKLPIKYTDADDEEHEEIFYFNLSERELLKMQVGVEGGYSKLLQNILETKNEKEVFKQLEELILSSYGLKSEDSKGFDKSPEIRNKFENSFAYQALFLKVTTDDNAAWEFIKGIFPKEMSAHMEKAATLEEAKKKLAAPPTPPTS